MDEFDEGFTSSEMKRVKIQWFLPFLILLLHFFTCANHSI